MHLRADTCTWISLVSLTVAAFAAGHSGRGAWAIALILAAAATKAALVAWNYMHLRSAHLLWKWGVASLVLGFLGLIAWLE